jgi:hypothetical protein
MSPVRTHGAAGLPDRFARLLRRLLSIGLPPGFMYHLAADEAARPAPRACVRHVAQRAAAEC